MQCPHRLASVASSLAFSLLALAHPTSAQCQAWGAPFLPAGANGTIRSSTVFDDGSGPALYVAGEFTLIGGVPAQHIARWDGSSWTALGSGLDGTAVALHAFDDGGGPALYASGGFTNAGGVPANRVARWRGGAWSALGPGLLDLDPKGLVGFDDGGGAKLYACGSAFVSTHLTVGRVERWNGSNWTIVGGDFLGPSFSGFSSGTVASLAVHDDGSGPALFAGGTYYQAGGTLANGVARWSGGSWSALGAGIPPGFVGALCSFDDGSGAALYAGGLFTNAGGVAVANLARWRSGAWSDVGGGTNSYVLSLGVHDDGSGAALYAGGSFASAGGSPAPGIARWSGSSWSSLAGGLASGIAAGQGLTLCSLGAPGAAGLYCGGAFDHAGGIATSGIARWTAVGWTLVGSSGNTTDAPIHALAAHDEGSGRALYAGGSFLHAGQLATTRVARWDGTSWSALGNGLDAEVDALASHDDGSGPKLYAGGQFTHSGAVAASHVARWDGAGWTQVGAGLPGNVDVLLAFDDGSGRALYAGGSFPGGIARWDGTNWNPVGAGLNGEVRALALFDDSSGPVLCAGGDFSASGALGVGCVTRWNGLGWSGLGSMTGSVHALRACDLGSGPRLFAGGATLQWGGPPPSMSLASWNGAAWSGLASNPAPTVEALASFDDGAGVRLYVGGSISNVLERFDGANFAAFGGTFDLSSSVLAFASWDSGPGGAADLYLGGSFSGSGAAGSRNLARWRGCGDPGTSVCAGDGSAGACPCANTGASGRGCDNSISSGGARLVSSGWNSLQFDTLVFTSSGELATSTSVFLQGTAQIAPVAFGDGLRCAGGVLKRLFVKSAVSGTATAPAVGDAPIHVRSALLGDPLSPGITRTYQVYYRDANLGFCPAPVGSSFNVSNGLRISWTE